MICFRITAFIAGIFLVSILSSPLLADPVLSIAPSTSTVSVGGTVTFDVNISDITNLSAYQFDINFDPAVASAISTMEGSFLVSGGGFVPNLIDNVGGTVSVADTLIGPLSVSGTGTLAIITMSGFAAGTTTLDFANVIFLDPNFNLINPTLVGGSLTVSSTSVPEPSSFLLLLVGISTLLLWAVKKQVI